jgi:hypothetical protein
MYSQKSSAFINYIFGDDGRESVMRWKMFLGEKKGMSQGLGSVCQELLL